MFPEYISKYREMTDTISMMTGLAVSNARKYTLLEKAKSEIAKSELLFKTIFSEAPIGIALIDSYSGQILEVNSKFAQIAGRTIEEMVKIDWMQITHPDDVQKDLDNMALLNAGKINGFQMEKRYLLPDDSWVWILMTIAPVMIQENDTKRHLCMIDDITEWKKYEARILETNEKLRQVIAEKDKFFSIISHDLRSPLASVVSLLEMMTENFSEFPPEELYRFISNSFNTANSLFQMLKIY
jgi:PAS domain S-box-containing protein